jgi:SAM-dependent methyltransferase
MRRRNVVLLLISAAVLADEVVLVRAFSIGLWHHFAYMVISVALLGFGASGTLLALLARRKTSRDTQGGEAGWLAASAVLFALTLPLAFALVQKIPFDPFLIVWDRRQLLYLGCYYLVMFVPFFAAATAIGLALITKSEESPRLYFYNLVGSAAGAALSVCLLEVAPVEQTVLAVAGLAQGAALFAALDVVTVPAAPRARLWAVLGIFSMFVLTLYFISRPPVVRLSQYKGLTYALNLPKAHLLVTRSSPIGRIDVVESSAIRQAPGLSLVTPQEAAVPQQLGFFVDAETAGAINAFDGNTRALGYLDWMSTAAQYFARPDSRRVCVLGAGGGANVLLALRHGAQHVDAVEVDPNVVDLLRNDFHKFSGGLYERADVHVHVAEGRAFLESANEEWDIIDISLVDSFAAAAVGLGAVNESYLYTQEALATYLQHLLPQGVLSVTRWIRTPPRDEIKLFATAVAALEGMGLNPADRLVLLRSWATATLLVKREPFSPEELNGLRRWVEERLFDVAYFPGIGTGEGNRFNVLAHDSYAEATNALLAGAAQREEFFRKYPFFVTPATDNRPYFFHFFRWRALPLMLSKAGFAWVPFVEWGYLILVATLIQSLVLGGLLMVLPFALVRGEAPSGPRYGRGARLLVFAYFLALGVGFMFVEMALIQRLVFFLANPVYAVAVVLAGLLLVAGLGSWSAAWLVAQGYSVKRLASMAAFGVAAVSAIYALGLYPALRTMLGLPLGARVAVAFAVMLPFATMGMLFPLGLRQLGCNRAELLPWAWAINGCASVVATSLATLLALGTGLAVVLFVASACYVVAALAVRQWASAPVR